MKKDTTSIGIIAPELQKQYLDIFTPIREQAFKDAITLGRKNMPAADERILSAAGLINSSYHNGNAQMMNSMKPEMHAAKYKRDKAELGKRRKEIDDTIKDLEHQNLLDHRSLANTVKPPSLERNPFLYFLLCLIYLGETYFNSLAFEFLRSNWLGAFLLGFVVACIEALLAYTIAKHINRIEQGEKKLYLKTGFYVLVNLAIIVAMSVLRAQMIAESEMTVPTWAIFCINITLLVGAIILSKLAFPSEKESDERRQLRERHEKIKEREEQIQKLQGEMKEISEKDEKIEDDFQFIKSQVAHLARLIEAHYRETVEMFKSENLITRSDGKVPPSFAAVVPKLQLPTFKL